LADFQFQQLTIETDFTKTHKLFYGDPGTGKTVFATIMNDARGMPPYFIFTEKGNGVTRPWGKQVLSWSGFLKLRDILVNQKKVEMQRRFGCLVFDVIGDFEDMAAKAVSVKANVATISDLAHGKGYVLHEEAIKEGFLPLMALMPCVFIAHTKDRQVQSKGEPVTIITSNLGKRAFNFLNGKVDFICYFQAPTKSEHYEITMRPDTGRIAKSRYPQMNRSFRNIKDHPEIAWAEMQRAFHQPEVGVDDGTRSST